MAIEKGLLDQLLAGRDPETVFAQDGLLDELKKGLSERVLNAELDPHLDAETAEGRTNRRNGRSQKTVLTGTSKIRLDIKSATPAKTNHENLFVLAGNMRLSEIDVDLSFSLLSNKALPYTL